MQSVTFIVTHFDKQIVFLWYKLALHVLMHWIVLMMMFQEKNWCFSRWSNMVRFTRISWICIECVQFMKCNLTLLCVTK